MEFALAALGAVNVGTLVIWAIESRAWRDERGQLLNRLMSRTPGEYRMLEQPVALPVADERKEFDNLPSPWSV